MKAEPRLRLKLTSFRKVEVSDRYMKAEPRLRLKLTKTPSYVSYPVT